MFPRRATVGAMHVTDCTYPVRRAPLVRRGLRGRFVRRGLRGMTLVEIMIVVVIMGLIASAIGIGVFAQARKAKERTAEQEVLAIEQAVELYQQDHANACPTMTQLRQDGQLSRRARERDPWDNEYIVTCNGGDVTVHSKGPDGRDGTEDDIPHANANGGGGGGGGGNGNGNGH